MGSGGSQTLWSPSNEAGAYKGVSIDTVHSSFSLEKMNNNKFRFVYLGWLNNRPCFDGLFPGLSLMVGLCGSLLNRLSANRTISIG